MRMRRKIHFGCKSEADISAHATCLSLKLNHHFGSLNTFRISWIIFHFSGYCKLPTGLYPLIKYRIQTGTAGINSCGISCRAGSYDQAFYFFIRSFHTFKNFVAKITLKAEVAIRWRLIEDHSVLTGNNHGSEFGPIAIKSSQCTIADISDDFPRLGKGIANTLSREFPGIPEPVGRTVDIAK